MAASAVYDCLDWYLFRLSTSVLHRAAKQVGLAVLHHVYVSCFSKIQIGFTFLVPAHPVVLEKGSLNRCVCVVIAHIFNIKTNCSITSTRYDLLLVMFRDLCVCLLVTTWSCATIAGRLICCLGYRFARALIGEQIPRKKGNLLGEGVKYMEYPACGPYSKHYLTGSSSDAAFAVSTAVSCFSTCVSNKPRATTTSTTSTATCNLNERVTTILRRKTLIIVLRIIRCKCSLRRHL